MVKKYCIFLLCLFLSSLCYCQQIALEQIEADRIEYKGKIIILTGNVRVRYSFGSIHCDKASLDLAKKSMDAKDEETGAAAEKIILEGNVEIDFPEGDKLHADRADIDCTTMEGIFSADEPRKVIYFTTMGTGDQKQPIKASSKKLLARLAKSTDESGYKLSDLRGDGAVLIEYVNSKGKIEQQPAENEVEES